LVEIVGFGQCCLDYLALGDDYPPEDHKAEFRNLLIQGGGPVATALVCLARLGRKTGLIGLVGGDGFGREIRAGLEEEGVETSYLVTRENSSSQFSFILVNPHRSSRTIHWTRSTGAPLEPLELPVKLLSQAKVLHLAGLEAESSLAAARIAKEAGVKVVLDIGTLRDHTLELIGFGDHVIASEIFKETFAPGAEIEEAVRRLHGLGPEAAVITLGRAGSVGTQGREIFHQPAFPVRALDTTGAGDAYHGGYIQALLEGSDLEERMRFASAVAALGCTALGGRTGLPTRAGVDEFLAAQQGEQAQS
jgi:sulfofructose kinase